jgi:uncharacterized coiled-coil protein SlyX
MALDQSVVDSVGLGQQFDRRIFELEGKSAAQAGDVADLQQQESELSTTRAQRARDAAAELKPASDKLREAAHKAADEPIQKEERMEPFQRPALDPQELQKTFGMLLVASMFAGKASRSPYNNTMTALTGAMNGFMKEDDHQVAQSLAIYDTNLAAMKERNAALQRDMAANDRKNKNNVAAWTLEHDLILERYDFDDKAAGHEQKSLSDKVKRGETILSSTEKAIDRLTVARAQIGERHDAAVERKRHDEEMERVARENAATRKDAVEKHGAAKVEAQAGSDVLWTPAEVDFFAASALQGNWQWRTGLGRTKTGSENIQRVDKRISSLAKELGISPAEMGTIQSVAKATDASLKQLTVRAGALEQSSKKIDKDIATLDHFIESGTAGSVKLINRPLNYIREKFSSPELTELVLAAQIVGTEYERMINGGLLSAAQLHEGAREDAHKLLNADMTPEQIRRTVKLMRTEINNQRSAFDEQLKETTTKRADVMGSVKAAVGAKPAAAAPFQDAEKERRYQEWKAKNGAQ